MNTALSEWFTCKEICHSGRVIVLQLLSISSRTCWLHYSEHNRICQERHTLIKKKIKFSSYTRKFSGIGCMQSHIWLTVSSYIGKILRISSYIRKAFLIYDFAPDPIWISLYMRKFFFHFYQCTLYIIWTQHAGYLHIRCKKDSLFLPIVTYEYSYHQACGRPQSGCPWMRLLKCGCPWIRLSEDTVVHGCGFPWWARFSAGWLSMDAVVLRRGFPWRGCPWIWLSLGAVFRGAVVNRCGCPRARFSVSPFRSPPHLSFILYLSFTPLYLTMLQN
jgi:hypothetical protein